MTDGSVLAPGGWVAAGLWPRMVYKGLPLSRARDRRGNQFTSRLASCLVQRDLDITETNSQLSSAGLDDIQSS